MWEEASAFGFRIEVRNVPLEMGRERDMWFLKACIRAGYPGKELGTLNRVKNHQKVLFLSDIFCAGGHYIDEQYLQLRELDENWSTLRFPNKDPTRADFELWKETLDQLAPRGRVSMCLRAFKDKSHKIWP